MGGDTDGVRKAWWHVYGEKCSGSYAAFEFRCILFIRLKRGRVEKFGERGMTENENCGGCCCL